MKSSNDDGDDIETTESGVMFNDNSDQTHSFNQDESIWLMNEDEFDNNAAEFDDATDSIMNVKTWNTKENLTWYEK